MFSECARSHFYDSIIFCPSTDHPGYNLFTGTLASELGLLTQLTALCMGGNSFNGTLPSELGLLTQLTHLHLDDNSFTGTIPNEFSQLTLLETLWIGSFDTLIYLADVAMDEVRTNQPSALPYL